MLRNVLILGAIMIVPACGAPSGTSSPRTDDQKLVVAREIAAIGFSTNPPEQRYAEEAASYWKTLDINDVCEVAETEAAVAHCEQQAPQLMDEMKAAADEYVAAIKTKTPELTEEMAVLLARNLSGEELAVLRDYYRSPTARSALRKRSEVQVEYIEAEQRETSGALQAYTLKAGEITVRLQALMSDQPTKPAPTR